MRLELFMSGGILCGIFGCSSYEGSVHRPATAATSNAATGSGQDTATKAGAADATAAKDQPIYLPSQQAKYYKMTGEKPTEVCMEKGWTWLYQGFLKPQCAACHNQDNKFGVNAFAQPNDAAASFEVMKTAVAKDTFLNMVLRNSFCSSCTIKKEDPLYKDLQYFTEHLLRCETN